jgi:putative membrane protein
MSNLSDFNQPQKQYFKGLLVLIFYQFQEIIRQFWIPILYIILKSDFKEHPEYFLVIFLVIFLVFIIVFLKYVNFTFYIDYKLNELVIEEGILNKSKISIPINKIQQVKVNQSFIQKISGVYSLSIDTAGSDKNEVKINALNLETANFFKNKLMELSKSNFNNFETINKEKIVLKISFITLLKVALTSHYGKSLTILFGFIAAIYNTIDDLNKYFKPDSSFINPKNIDINMYFNAIFLLIISFIVLIFVVNIVTNLLKYYNFSIKKNSDYLTITSGFFINKIKILKPDKVQTITYFQNYFQKKLKFYNLKIQQATGDEFSKQSIENNIIVPGCSEQELQKIMNYLYKIQPEKQLILIPKIQFFVPVLVFFVLIPLIIFYSIGYFYDKIIVYQWLFLVYTPILLIVNYLRYKNEKLYFDGKFIQKSSGAWDVSHHIVASSKLQGFTIKQKIWQQKNDIGDILFYTASGSFRFRFANYSKLETYLNYWLYQVENE